jgi:hypothetical protein
MLGPNSKVNLWGCTVCYNHQRINGDHYCSVREEGVEHLRMCPLGLKTAFIDTIA